MLRKIAIKTLVSIVAANLVVQPVFAQQAHPVEGDDLPALRTTSLAQNTPKMGASRIKPIPHDTTNAGGPEPAKSCKPQSGQVDWNWDKAALGDLVTAISRMTCKNFIIKDDQVKDKITILSRTQVSVDQAWQSFLSALEANNKAVVQAGKFYKIVGGASGSSGIGGVSSSSSLQKSNTPILRKGDTIPADEGYVTMIYDTRNIPKAVAMSVLKELLKVAPVEIGSEYLLFTDTALNIRRAMNALEIVDVPGAANRIHVVDLEYATAKEMLTRINEFLPASSGSNNTNNNFMRPRIGGGFEPSTGESGGSHKIVADDRTNKLIILASDKTYLLIREFIDKLDVRATSATAQLNMYQLKNQKAADVEKTLTALVQGTANRSNQPRPAYMPPQEGQQFEGEIKVKADEKTNTLVISSSRRDFTTISEILAKLDKRRPQVFVEAVILEISTDDQENFGLDFYGGFPFPNIPGFGGTYGIAGNAGGQQLARKVFSDYGSAVATNSLGASALTLGNFVSTLGVLGLGSIPFGNSSVQVPSVGAVLNFLTTFGNVEIIATPSLMTVDNEKSSIKIGERRPMSQGTTQVAGLPTGALAGGLGSISNSIKIETIENTLEITPSVNDNDEILMKIDQDIQDLGEPIQIPGAGALNTIKTKKTNTMIMTSDQQTVVIGGLINRTKTHTEKKLPLLGDIPVLGYLFKSTEDKVRHSNLLLVLTPYVVRSPADSLKIYERKRREHEEFAKLYFGDRITKFDPHVDYTKKPGPIAKLLHEFDSEMKKAENDGPGLADEKVIRADQTKPKEETLQGTVSEIPGSEPETAMPVMPMPIPMPAEPVVPEPAPAAPVPAEGVQPAPAPATPNQAPTNVAPPASNTPAPNANPTSSGEVPLNPNPPPAPPPN